MLAALLLVTGLAVADAPTLDDLGREAQAAVVQPAQHEGDRFLGGGRYPLARPGSPVGRFRFAGRG